jgi:hypothetical protein
VAIAAFLGGGRPTSIRSGSPGYWEFLTKAQAKEKGKHAYTGGWADVDPRMRIPPPQIPVPTGLSECSGVVGLLMRG